MCVSLFACVRMHLERVSSLSVCSDDTKFHSKVSNIFLPFPSQMLHRLQVWAESENDTIEINSMRRIEILKNIILMGFRWVWHINWSDECVCGEYERKRKWNVLGRRCMCHVCVNVSAYKCKIVSISQWKTTHTNGVEPTCDASLYTNSWMEREHIGFACVCMWTVEVHGRWPYCESEYVSIDNDETAYTHTTYLGSTNMREHEYAVIIQYYCCEIKMCCCAVCVTANWLKTLRTSHYIHIMRSDDDSTT